MTIEATVCFPVVDDTVLLGEKQRKFAIGYLNGPGGRVEPGDTDIFATNARETEEEIGIRVKSARKVAEVVFHHARKDELKEMIVHFFIATEWDGVPRESEEMKHLRWYPIADLDYDRFLPGDRLFIPHILLGKFIKATVTYNEDESINDEDTSIEEVEGFEPSTHLS